MDLYVVDVLPLGVLELLCIAICLIMGAVLATRYIGGVIVTHWRVSDPPYVPTVLGLLIWLGIYVRESRLKELIPLRSRVR